MFFEITQARLQIGELGRSRSLTSNCATPYPVPGLLNITLQALQLNTQLIKSGGSPRQVTSCITLSLFKLSQAVTYGLQSSFNRLLALTTLALQRLGVSTNRLQVFVTRTAHQDSGQEHTHQHKQSFHGLQ